MDFTRRSALALAGGAAAATAITGGAMAQQRRLGSATKTEYWAATITPCNKDGAFDPGAMAAILQYHKQCGADGVVVLGTSGEFPSFTVAERKAILEAAVKNRNGLNVMVNPGTSNIGETIDLAKHAQSVGADSLLVIPPFYFNRPPVEGVIKYYSMLMDAVQLPTNLYHIPGTSEVPISLELLKAVHHYPHLAGIKDSSGDPAGYAAFVKGFPDLNMRTGTGNNLEMALDNGMGAILAEGNLFSRECADIFKTYRAKGAWKAKAQKLNAAIGAIMKVGGPEAAYSYGQMKYLLSQQMGGGDWYPRVPYPHLTDAQKAKLREALAAAKAVLAS